MAAGAARVRAALFASGERWVIDTWWATPVQKRPLTRSEGSRAAPCFAPQPARWRPTMFAYIFKRLLLMVPTLLGVLLLTFVVIQFVPGGPVEQYVAEAKAGTRRRGREGGGHGYRGRAGRGPRAP